MKKKTLFLLLFFTVLFSCSILAFGSEKKENADGSALYVATTPCPSEYLVYAREHAAAFVLGTGETVDYATLRVGSPFAFADPGADVYYFPILCNEEITYLFRVYPDGNGGYNGAITRFLATELESLASQTSSETPLTLNLVNDKIVATIGQNSYILHEYSATGTTLSATTEQPDSLSVVDTKTAQNWVLTKPQQRAQSCYIPLNCTDSTTYYNSWCVAFCTAAILRTLGETDVEAIDVMSLFYRQPVSGSYVTLQQAVGYGNFRGVSSTYVTYALGQSALMTEIDNQRPVLLGMISSAYDHAVVLRGYSLISNTWNVWDPMANSYQTYSIGGVYVPTGYSSTTHSYSHIQTVYNWS